MYHKHDNVMRWKHFLHYWPFVREFINAVPSQMASYAQLQFFLNCQPKQATEETIKLPVILNMIHMYVTVMSLTCFTVYYNDITWASWDLKSLATWLFVQKFV